MTSLYQTIIDISSTIKREGFGNKILSFNIAENIDLIF